MRGSQRPLFENYSSGAYLDLQAFYSRREATRDSLKVSSRCSRESGERWTSAVGRDVLVIIQSRDEGIEKDEPLLIDHRRTRGRIH